MGTSKERRRGTKEPHPISLEASLKRPQVAKRPKKGGTAREVPLSSRRPNPSEHIAAIEFATRQSSRIKQRIDSVCDHLEHINESFADYRQAFVDVRDYLDRQAARERTWAYRKRFLLAIVGCVAGFVGLLYAEVLAGMLSPLIAQAILVSGRYLHVSLRVLCLVIIVATLIWWIFASRWSKNQKIGAVIATLSAALHFSHLMGEHTIGQIGDLIGIAAFVATLLPLDKYIRKMRGMSLTKPSYRPENHQLP